MLPATPDKKNIFEFPIRIKLMLITLGVSAFALALTAGLEIIFDWKNQKALIVQRMIVTTKMLALQSQAPLHFLDQNAAKENLNALAADPYIQEVCIYDELGSVFSSYFQTSADSTEIAQLNTCPVVKPSQLNLGWNIYEIFFPIELNRNRVGMLYLKRTLADLHAHMYNQILYKFLIIIFVIGVLAPIASYFRRSISEPIIQLAELSRQFSRTRDVQLSVVKPSEDELGELFDAFNVMMNEVQKSENNLQHAIDELSSSNRELEKFAHICSHDLQEPLRMVSNYSALLEKKCSSFLNDETKQYLFFITDGASRMRELINDILTYARTTQPEPFGKVDLNLLLQSVIKNLHMTINERGAIIHLENMPTIYGSKTLLLQIFQNLISNGIKFCKTAPELWVRAKRLKNAWQISVQDNGIGIDEKYHSKVFEIFKRLNRREEFQGTGIGLSICKKAVELHHGNIWIESTPNKGTTFHFTIPDQPMES